MTPEDLREAESRLALAVSAANDGIWDWDVSTQRVYLSSRCQELLGMPGTEAAVGWREAEALFPVHPDDRGRWQQALETHFEGQATRFDIELRILRDGEVHWLRLASLICRSADATPLRWTGAVSDITAHKQVEVALRRSEERFALAVAGSNAGIWDWDIASDLMFHSERTQQLHGLTPGPTLRKRSEWRALWQLHPDDVAMQLQAVDDHLAGRTAVYEGEWRVWHADGSYRWVRAHGLCLRDEQGRPIRMAGSVTDIAASKQAEMALRESEERYALAVASSNEGIFDWDLIAERVYVSQRAQELLDLELGPVWRGRREWQRLVRVHPADIEALKSSFARHLRGDLPAYDVEFRIVLADGSCRWLRQRGVASSDAAGKPYRMTGYVGDITQRKLAEQELRDLERQLRQGQRLEAMGTLAGGIAHDFNNILGAILGYGEMALRDAPLESRLRRDLDSVIAAGERGRALVERILAFSCSGVGERVAVHVEGVVREALELVAAKLPDSIRIVTELNAGRAAMLGDPTQVHQVVMNLATNAVQAMPRGGTLRVSLRVQRLDFAHAATTGIVGAGEYLVLALVDDGVGIERDLIERIFDPFFTTKEVGVGTGLGLSLVHGIVSDVGGAIDVYSRPGDGSAFTVFLPRSGEADAAAQPVPGELPRGSGQRVLVVDDEEPLARLTSENLTDLGYVAVPFTSSAAALEAFRAQPDRFDAVLTDERMPGMSGAMLIHELHRLRPDIPKLLVSGYVGADLLQRARQAGAFEVLKKPLQLRDLAISVHRALHRPSR